MKVLFSTAASLLIIAALTLSTFVNADESITDDDVCRYFSDGTKIRDPDSCNQYITCNNFKSTYTACSGSTPFYDRDTSKCVKELDDDSSCYVSCVGAVNRFISDPKSCRGYYYCLEEDFPIYGKCPDELHFNATTQSCIYKSNSECRAHNFDFCKVVPDKVKFDDPSNCAQYFTCTKGVLSSTACKSLYYEVKTGNCVQKSQVNCPVHPIPNNACGTEKSPLKNAYVSDGATCRGYLYCADKSSGPDANPTWHQCPNDYFFDTKKSACVHPLDVACTEDRCDGRTLTFVNGNTDCREYLRCENGKTAQTSNCGNLFFDELLGKCVSNIINYTACK